MITTACISEEIANDTLSGSNIRLIKLLQYLPNDIQVEIYTHTDHGLFGLTQNENINIITIESKLYTFIKRLFKNRNIIKKVLWYFVNYYSAIDYFWAIKACRKIQRSKVGYQYIILQVPSLTNILYGAYLSRKYSFKVVYDLRDDLINYKNRMGINSFEKWMMKAGSIIICATRGSQNNLQSKYPHWNYKVKYVPNGFDLDDYPKAVNSQENKSDIKIIVYTGAIYHSRMSVIQNIFDTINELLIDHKSSLANIRIIFYTSNTDIEKMIMLNGLSEYVSRCDVVEDRYEYYRILTQATYLLSMNKDTPFSIPGKLYEYVSLNANVIHFDNCSIANEILMHYPSSNLILLSEMWRFKQILLSMELENKHGKYSMPKYVMETFSRKNIANAFVHILRNSRG
jgi:glycosyltransferase involved in cell wall biosynthesis